MTNKLKKETGIFVRDDFIYTIENEYDVFIFNFVNIYDIFRSFFHHERCLRTVTKETAFK
jgi:hypothetical protein